MFNLIIGVLCLSMAMICLVDGGLGFFLLNLSSGIANVYVAGKTMEWL